VSLRGAKRRGNLTARSADAPEAHNTRETRALSLNALPYEGTNAEKNKEDSIEKMPLFGGKNKIKKTPSTHFSDAWRLFLPFYHRVEFFVS
jgi:hypothetical protein